MEIDDEVVSSEEQQMRKKRTFRIEKDEDDHVVADVDGRESVEQKIPKFVVKASLEVKLREVLRNIISAEIKLCSDASKRFIKLLKSEDGGDLLRLYVQASSNFSELIEAWKVRRGKPGMSYVLSLIAAILSHVDGKSNVNNMGSIDIRKAIDKFARLIIEEKLGDVYRELSSKEAKRQSAALILLASIVRRGRGLASEVAKIFDFKLPIFSRLADYRKKQIDKNTKHSTRKPFIGFAMSFLEVGKPGLLRWVLQQKEMYSGVLRRLANDDDDTVSYVLSTLRDRVLIKESLVSPALRSVLFGNVTLEQLVIICERGNYVAELANNVLIMVCTDPCNGLMPDKNAHPHPLKGNAKRLLGLMKKLRATEVVYHKDLLLAIVSGRPLFAAAYMDDFPYNLEDHKSTYWLAAVSLAAELVSSVRSSLSAGFLDLKPHNPPAFDSAHVQYVMKCACPRVISRSVINKGLLHSDFLVKHGTLRLLFESLNLLDCFVGALEHSSHPNNLHGWVSLKQEIQNEFQMSLPDPQVLLTLLSSLSTRDKISELVLKRAADRDCDSKHNKNRRKKLKTSVTDEETDIIVGGISSVHDASLTEDNEASVGAKHAETLDAGKDCITAVTEIWGLQGCPMGLTELKDIKIFFHSKVLDTVKVYHRIMPAQLEGSYDFFKLLPGNPLSLPVLLQHSLLSLLVEHIGWCPKRGILNRAAPLMYKHLRLFIDLLLRSPMSYIREQAEILARAAMLSTGGFEKNSWEIALWFAFLPGYGGGPNLIGNQGEEVFHNLSSVVVSFLCDAVSSIGNNLFKYYDRLRCCAYRLKGFRDFSPDFSPLVICVLEKCLRLLNSESGTFTQHEKSTISLYVSNTLSYILQTQVQGELLSSVISLLLSEGFDNCCSKSGSFQNSCQWRPLQNLQLFSVNVTDEQTCTISCGLDVILANDVGGVDISARRPISFLPPKEISHNGVFLDSESIAFSSFLEREPFYVLFPVLVNFEGLKVLGSSRIVYLLLAKLSDLSCNRFMSYLRLLLFSDNKMRLSYRVKPSSELEKLSEICYVLINNMLKTLLDVHLQSAYSSDTGASFSSQYIQDVFGLILCHPAVSVSLVCPLDLCEELTGTNFGENFENVLNLCVQQVNKMDHRALDFLVSVFDWSIAICDDQGLGSKIDDCAKEQILGASKLLLAKLLLLFRKSFDQCMKQRDFLPLLGTLYTLHIFIYYISPFELLQLVDWMFNRIALDDCTALKSTKDSLYSVGLYIAGRALEVLFNLAWPTNMKTVCFDCIWGLGNTDAYIPVFERIYVKICKLSIQLKSKLTDLCLLRAVNAACKCRHWQHRTFPLPLSMAILRVVMSTPVEILCNCIHRTNMTRAQLLFVLVEVSPLHMSVFGRIFSNMLSTKLLPQGGTMEEAYGNSLLDEDFLMLLPAALSYLDSKYMKFGEQSCNFFRCIPSFFSRILFDGFVNWKNFVSKSIFQIDVSRLLPLSMEELSDVVNGSLLGKATLMLRHHLDNNRDSMTLKRRLELFNSICPQSSANDDLLEYDISEVDSYSFDQCLNFVNRVVAKISICRMLLSAETDQIQFLQKHVQVSKKTTSSKVKSYKDSPRVRLINILVHSWQLIVKKFPSISNNKGTTSFLCKFLEVHILAAVSELTKEVRTILEQCHSLPFLDQFAKSCLLYRFEDPKTLNYLCNVLSLFSQCKYSRLLILQLLLDHSKFAPTIHSISRSAGYSLGPFLKPMSSILRSLADPSACPHASDPKDNPELYDIELKQLQVIKFLRRLCCFGSDSEGGVGIDYKELLFLLLSSYGATLSQIDLEIYSLMRDIELADRSASGSIAEVDYLWGTAALKLRNEQIKEAETSKDTSVAEAITEGRRRRFRDYLSIDPKMCALTVLYFPYDRTMDDGPSYWKNLQQETSGNDFEADHPRVNRKQQYDPVFILRFSIHCLLVGYLEPLEFASLGLLAVVFVSISSPSEGIRKLGYEALERFKDALEKFHKRKDLMWLRLLLTYLQNGIEEPWQQIPSITAVFFAEISFILLDPANGHYSAISKLLMCSSKVNLKCVPLFHDFFWSSSTDFKMERLWILRLLYAGMNLDDDTQISVRSSILETLMSFYFSPLSDNDSKELILLIVKKSVRLQKMAHYLVERCGLFSWLSSILSCIFGQLCRDSNRFTSKELIMVLQVASVVIASRSIIEWLRDYALEQLSEFSLHMFNLFVGGFNSIKHNISLANMGLHILVSTLNISLERKTLQPHFTVSLEGSFQLYEAIDGSNNGKLSPAAEFALKAIVMSTPSADIFHMDQKKLSRFITWSVCAALQSDSSKIHQLRECNFQSICSPKEEEYEGSLTLKLLHWLTASVIVGRLAWKPAGFGHSVKRPRLKELKSFVESIKEGCGENISSVFGSEEILAHALLYLQQLLCMKHRVCPSVVCGLCLLLLPGFSNFAGSNSLRDYGNVLTSLLMRIRSPAEASPAWQWSIYQPCEYLSKSIDPERMDELHACQTLLLIFSNVLGKPSLDKQVMLYHDIERTGVFEWERNMLQT